VTKTDSILKQFRDLNVWRRGEERAPHKPLLVLFALGRLQSGSPRLLPFDEIENPLTRLLEEFGPPRKSIHPELPFYHLQADGVWEIDEQSPLTRRQGSKNPLRTELRKWKVGGGFTPQLYQELKDRPEVVRELARELLAAHFPESLHESIARSVGLDLEGSLRNVRRDPAFRSEVVAAWDHRCAFCGFSVQLDNADIALDAAHIRWCQFGGPDSLSNGLACCSIHHQAFDRGAISISDDQRILISSRLYGNGAADSMFLALSRAPLRTPNRKGAAPKVDFLGWHRTQVFRGDPRD
jgi:putative restriction endonuclease